MWLDILTSQEKLLVIANITGIVLVITLFAHLLAKAIKDNENPYVRIVATAVDQLDYRYRGCMAVRLLVNQILDVLNTTPDVVMSCKRIKQLFDIPRLTFNIPQLALVMGSMEFGRKMGDFFDRVVQEHCVEGSIRFGVLAASLQQEVEKVCSDPNFVSLYKE